MATALIPTDAPSAAAIAEAGNMGRHSWLAIAEIAALSALVGIAVVTAIIVKDRSEATLLSPTLLTLLLVANLVPAILLIVFAGRRIAIRRAAARSGLGPEARLHTRLVALYSAAAAIPTVLVAIFASFLFQSGMDFWFSERSRGMFENAVSVAQNFFDNEKRDVGANTLAMATDLRNELARTQLESQAFYDFYVQQVVVRELSQSAIIEVGRDGIARTVAAIDPDNRATEARLPAATIAALGRGNPLVTAESGDGVEATVRLFPDRPVYLYGSRSSTLLGRDSIVRARSIFEDYNALFARSQALQFRFVLALYLGSLLFVGLAVWAAILVADRVVIPIDQLVFAVQRVAGGDLAARVAVQGDRRDEIAILADSFNSMTEQLGEQTRELLDANDQLDNRRAFIEAVLSSVATGVLSLDEAGMVRLGNSAASRMLGMPITDMLNRPISEVAPSLASWIAEDGAPPVISVDRAGETRTFQVRAISGEHGHVLTLDDITQQLSDQRRAAWSDIARRIAHEIKNPLTPIQLAAERLQRRFGDKVDDGGDTFRKLTSTIVRQVGDLRRMVDEFSSFARMPKPIFRDENLNDIVRQAVFLHEVAQPDIEFRTLLPEPAAILHCDRRLLAQALTNILKNAVEAIHRVPGEGRQGLIETRLDVDGDQMTVTVADNGVGLPDDRDAIVEPYVTMREGGTGLGLAIVKKVVEEHGGQLSYEDRANGGTVMTIVLKSGQREPIDRDTITQAPSETGKV